MKIYTRNGDAGETSIWAGRRLGKDQARVEAILLPTMGCYPDWAIVLYCPCGRTCAD
jgi:hypothetical protein